MSPNPRRPRRPSFAVVLAGLAVVIAMSGTAVAAGQLVSIVDKSTGKSAKVTGGGLKVNGSVTAREAGPTDLVSAVGESFSSSPSTCTKVYEPPSGKALILTGTEVAAYSVGTSGNVHRIFVSPTATPCTFGSGRGLVGLATLTSPGTVVRQYPAGVPVPNGSAVYTNQFVQGGAANSATVAIDGYLVPGGTVPEARQAARLGEDGGGGGVTGTGPR